MKVFEDHGASTALPFFVQGGDGCISVTSNVLPELCRTMFESFKLGHMVKAQQLSVQISDLTSALFRETDLVPLEYALSLLGLMSPKVRLPLVGLTEQTKVQLAIILAQMSDENPENNVRKVPVSANNCRAVAI